MSPPASTPGHPPARVGVLTSQPIVAAGLQSVLAQGNGTWQVVLEPDGATPPEVVLYDALLLHAGDGSDLDQLVEAAESVVIAVARDLRPDLAAQALDRGAAATVSLGISCGELVEVVHAALDGRLHESRVARRRDGDVPLGREAGLSGRESEVVRLIVRGYTNQEIADELYLSVNSIKTYIRTAYSKIGAGSRQHAVTWAIQHGFPIERDAAPPRRRPGLEGSPSPTGVIPGS